MRDPTHKLTANNSTPPLGQRFSHVYMQRGTPRPDSVRMRHRLALLIDAIPDLKGLSRIAESELGIASPWSTPEGWPRHLAKWQLEDVLDLVTVAYRLLVQKLRTGIHNTRAPEQWIAETNRIFSEEYVSYTVDNAGGVRFVVDEEHARNVSASISVLQTPRYANVLHAFEEVGKALNEVPPNGKHAIRSVFAAAEGLFRLVLPNAPRLGGKEAESLRPILQRIYAGDKPALSASAGLLKGFQEWIEAAHFYRHEPGAADEISQPPLSLAVYIVSVGASHLRWLAEIDAARNEGTARQ